MVNRRVDELHRSYGKQKGSNVEEVALVDWFPLPEFQMGGITKKYVVIISTAVVREPHYKNICYNNTLNLRSSCI